MSVRPISFCTRVITMLLFCGTAAAPGQTTQPGRTWPAVVERLTDTVRGKDVESLATALRNGPVIRTFASDTLLPPERLLGVMAGTKLLAMHAYLRVPASLASDLADDFKSADVPEAVRRDMIIPDVAAERNANEIAARWITQVLKAEVESPVAVVVLWRKDKNESLGNSAAQRPLFLMIKGELVDDEYVIRQITFGDPLDKPR